jgi:transposase
MNLPQPKSPKRCGSFCTSSCGLKMDRDQNAAINIPTLEVVIETNKKARDDDEFFRLLMRDQDDYR